MKSGALFRYTPGFTSEVSLAEKAICDYSGFKYSVGFNSCGSALFIALKCVGVEAGDPVLCNAFSFTAVPSAVHHAGAIPTYVDTADGYVMDMEDLEKQCAANSDLKYLMLTHMRGKVAPMAQVYEIAERYGLVVVEDCAHALGIQYRGVQLGRSSRVACFSTQSAKMINSGEGGFLCTDDPEIAAKAACYAGCYESLMGHHIVQPPKEIFDAVKKSIPNYSLRMSDLTACCVRPQIDDLEDRIEKYNERYARIVERIAVRDAFYVPPILSDVRPVCDSLQFNLKGLSEIQVAAFLAHTKKRGMPVGFFGAADNARNFRNWQYSDIGEGLPKTEQVLSEAIDVRLPLSFSDEEIDLMGDVLIASLDDTLSMPE